MVGLHHGNQATIQSVMLVCTSPLQLTDIASHAMIMAQFAYEFFFFRLGWKYDNKQCKAMLAEEKKETLD